MTRLPPVAGISRACPLTYGQYHAVRFDTTQSLWRGEKRPPEVRLVHRGFMFAEPVDVVEVRDGMA